MRPYLPHDTAQQQPTLVVRSAALPPDQNPYRTYLREVSAGSHPALRHALSLFATTICGAPTDPDGFPWEQLRWQHLTAVLRQLAEQDYAPATVRRVSAAVKQVTAHARKLGLLDPAAHHELREVRPPRGERVPRGRAVPHDELRALFACEQGTATTVARNRAVLALCVGAGLRRAEAVALTLQHYDATARELRVRGKGNKERIVPLSLELRAAIETWLEVRGRAPGPLLCPCTRRGLRVGTPLTAGALYALLDRLSKHAHTPPVHPHDLRRTFGTAAVDAGGLTAAQRLLGHASVTTTQRYDRGADRRAREAVEKLALPVGPEQDQT